MGHSHCGGAPTEATDERNNNESEKCGGLQVTSPFGAFDDAKRRRRVPRRILSRSGHPEE